jgi:hypothetical protein
VRNRYRKYILLPPKNGDSKEKYRLHMMRMQGGNR